MSEENKSKLSAKEVENLKQEGHERALNGNSEPNTLGDELFDSEEEQSLRADSFERTNDVERDEETRKHVNEEDEVD